MGEGRENSRQTHCRGVLEFGRGPERETMWLCHMSQGLMAPGQFVKRVGGEGATLDLSESWDFSLSSWTVFNIHFLTLYSFPAHQSGSHPSESSFFRLLMSSVAKFSEQI